MFIYQLCINYAFNQNGTENVSKRRKKESVRCMNRLDFIKTDTTSQNNNNY